MGPLAGVKVVEIAGLGPGPFAAMMLADMGADVIVIERAEKAMPDMGNAVAPDLLNRGRRSVCVDLKQAAGVETVLRLLDRADALVEGFRPGVMERLGLGPDVCLARNPKLVYGRMTGWGQTGPLAHAAGHDINYIALSGALAHFGRAGEKPTPPINMVGDFGGGGMFLAFGIVCALLEASRSHKGQVVDAAMVDGSAVLMMMMHAFRNMGFWSDERGTNLIDTGAPFFDTYETKDGKFISIGSLEPQFYRLLLEKTELGQRALPAQMDRSQWEATRPIYAEVFKQKTRDEWCALLEGSDVCFAPVLSMTESMEHPHMRERNTFVDIGGVKQPAPAPRFSRTAPELPRPPAFAGTHTHEVLAAWGFGDDEIKALRDARAIA